MIERYSLAKFMKSIFKNIAGALSTRTCLSINQGNTTKPVIKIAETIEPRVEITVKLVDGDYEGRTLNEAWLLDVVDNSGASLINWHEQVLSPPLEVRQLDTDGKPALLFCGASEITLDLPCSSELRFLSHPWSGGIEVTGKANTATFNLYSSVAITRSVSIEHDIINDKGLNEEPPWGVEERQWLDKVKDKKPKVISVLDPDWKGVRSATENLVPDSLLIKDQLNDRSAERTAHLIVESGCKFILISGFPISYELLVRALKNVSPRIKIYVYWHSSFMQSNEDYSWHSFLVLHRLHNLGLIEKIGFAKKGMAETIALTGARTGFIMNYVRSVPDKPSRPLEMGPHIGIWSLSPIWRKNPYAMIAAAALVENAKLHVVGQERRAKELADLLGVNTIFKPHPLDQIEMPIALSQMDINLYVTLSECTPMLPLESLSVGVPCLLGPNSHLFEDHPYLHSRLVVPYPDRSEIIADMIKQALEDRTQIISEYINYAPVYNQKARDRLNHFFTS